MMRWELGSVALAVCGLAGMGGARGEVILQYFEAKWDTIESRPPDAFMAGYKGMWVPPPGRADTGDQSVGYDVFDRFDLGYPGDPTLYGTSQALRTMVREAHYADQYMYVDLILNHNGFRDHNTPGFESGGGYPGFAVTLPGDAFGDFHSPPVAPAQRRVNRRVRQVVHRSTRRFVRSDLNNAPQRLDVEDGDPGDLRPLDAQTHDPRALEHLRRHPDRLLDL